MIELAPATRLRHRRLDRAPVRTWLRQWKRSRRLQCGEHPDAEADLRRRWV